MPGRKGRSKPGPVRLAAASLPLAPKLNHLDVELSETGHSVRSPYWVPVCRVVPSSSIQISVMMIFPPRSCGG